MRMNTAIPLQVQQPDFMNALAGGAQTAAAVNQIRQANALAQMYQQYGPGIAQGDPAAMNALAQFDPNAALDVQDARQAMDARGLSMDATRQSMDIARNEDRRAETRLRILSDQEARQIAAQAQQKSAEERAAERAELESVLAGASQARSPEEWDQWVAQNGQEELVGQFGQRHMIIPSLMDVADVYDSLGGSEAPADFRSLQMRAEAANLQEGTPEYQQFMLNDGDVGSADPAAVAALRARAREAGLQEGTPEYQAFMLQGGAPREGIVMTQPDGTEIRIGGTAQRTSAVSPSSPEAMISTIDGILSDPALDYSTGVLSPIQGFPGTPQRRFGARTRQLEGQAFLQAYESLRGAGQITEIEGAKATQAIGRLDSGQSSEDYRAALNELREILVLGSQTPPGQAEALRGQSGASPVQQQSGPADDFVIQRVPTMNEAQLNELLSVYESVSDVPPDLLDAIRSRGQALRNAQ